MLSLMVNICCPSGSLKFLYSLGKGCSHDQPPRTNKQTNKQTLNYLSQTGFSGQKHRVRVAAFSLQEEFVLRVTGGREYRKTAHCCLQAHLSSPFLVLLVITVINLYHEYNYMPSPVIPSRESLKVSVVLEHLE